MDAWEDGLQVVVEGCLTFGSVKFGFDEINKFLVFSRLVFREGMCVYLRWSVERRGSYIGKSYLTDHRVC